MTLKNWRLCSVILAALIIIPAGALAQTPSEILGAWRDIQNPERFINIMENMAVTYKDGTYVVHLVDWGENGEMQVTTSGSVSEGTYSFADGVLTLHSQVLFGSLRRLENIPEFLSLEPLPLGDPEPLSAEEIAKIQEQLKEHYTAGNTPRIELGALFRNPSGDKEKDSAREKEIGDRVEAADSAARAWFIPLLRRIGWIDADRFGKDASTSAFMLLQHSQNLPAMRAALPLIERDAKAGKVSGATFAYLHDRTMMNLGKKQRYGTQSYQEGGEWYLYPLEDMENVDALRKEVGLGPLDEYLQQLAKTTGSPVRIKEEE